VIELARNSEPRCGSDVARENLAAVSGLSNDWAIQSFVSPACSPKSGGADQPAPAPAMELGVAPSGDGTGSSDESDTSPRYSSISLVIGDCRNMGARGRCTDQRHRDQYVTKARLADALSQRRQRVSRNDGRCGDQSGTSGLGRRFCTARSAGGIAATAGPFLTCRARSGYVAGSQMRRRRRPRPLPGTLANV
jgi:hypothetical protein